MILIMLLTVLVFYRSYTIATAVGCFINNIYSSTFRDFYIKLLFINGFIKILVGTASSIDFKS